MIALPREKAKPILYVGCPAPEREEAGRLLAAGALEVVWADTRSAALSKLQRRDMPVLLDLARGASALRTARELRTVRARTLIFGVVDARRPELTSEAVVSGFADVFARPLGPSRVVNALEREDAQQGERRLQRQAGVWDDLYSLSPSMGPVTARIAHAGSLRAGVMVRGERGTGRRIVARAIHAHQPTPARFVAVDCAAFAPDALEQELFGGEASGGAIPDPVTGPPERVSRAGRLYEAIGGTVYLRNVVAASARVQARLARVLSRRDAMLEESGRPIAMDVRVVAGVDPDFDRAVREGRVRDDLYRRLSAIRIDVPPLRNRREDIPAIANCFLRGICASGRLAPKTLSRPALSLIAALPWRGNAPELWEVLESAAGAAEASVSLESVLGSVTIGGGSAALAARQTLRQAHAQFERDYIANVLDQHRGSVSGAALTLGIERTNLYRKLRRLRVDGDEVAGVRKYHSRHIG
jgi:DNA-binding NtrC family response regulator